MVQHHTPSLTGPPANHRPRKDMSPETSKTATWHACSCSSTCTNTEEQKKKNCLLSGSSQISLCPVPSFHSLSLGHCALGSPVSLPLWPSVFLILSSSLQPHTHSHAQVQSAGHVHYFLPCSRLFQMPTALLSLISTIKTSSAIPWRACVLSL